MEIKNETVKRLRTNKGWSQQHLADVCDVNLRTIQRVENLGVASPETMMALASVFDVDKNQLIKKIKVPHFVLNFKSDWTALLFIISIAFLGGISGALIGIWLWG
jgi:transcriptional regulator with XRE-family HTH domain